ncbi:endonuclease [Metabacillus mangrovi]|uniref:endonuclease n=1 Tax=Metabacillus mangrovi TaxID=1491830 RepID=UPI003D323E38
MNNKAKRFLSLSLVFIFLLSLAAPAQIQAETGSGTWTSPYSVTQAIGSQTGSAKTVQGYVTGQPTSSATVATSNYPNDYAVAIADSPTETNPAKMLYVQLSDSFRSEFGLQSNPSLKGKQIKATGSLTAYFSHAGLKSPSQMELADGTPPPDDGGGSDGGGTSEPSPYDGTYYNGAIGKTGASLKTALHNIIDDHTELSYDAVWDALRNTDEDPANSSNVLLLYTGRSQSKFANGGNADDWNREHVWAKSHGDFGTAMGPGTDIHHLRPTDVTVNSSRGNLDFDNGGTQSSEAPGNYYDSDSWEPRDEVKGDVARMIFYMAVRYEGDSGEPDLEMNERVSNGSAPYMGKQSVLLEWHRQDPVSEFERNRNDVIYSDYQNNRNPFIDHPEWAEAVFN